MTKQEFLSASFSYGLHLSRDGKTDSGKLREIRISVREDLNGNKLPDRWTARVGSKAIYYTDLELYAPIVRPLSDLTKECVQADYNNGEPFVPIVELLKNSYFDTSIMPRGEIMSFAHSYSRIELITLNDLPLYLKWHFDIITEECEKVYVTETNNPY